MKIFILRSHLLKNYVNLCILLILSFPTCANNFYVGVRTMLLLRLECADTPFSYFKLGENI